MLVTGGGRAQLKVWTLLQSGGELQCTELADFMLLGSDRCVKGPWRKVQSVVRWDCVEIIVLKLSCKFSAYDSIH